MEDWKIRRSENKFMKVLIRANAWGWGEREQEERERQREMSKRARSDQGKGLFFFFSAFSLNIWLQARAPLVQKIVKSNTQDRCYSQGV